jgi:hypothetical protein
MSAECRQAALRRHCAAASGRLDVAKGRKQHTSGDNPRHESDPPARRQGAIAAPPPPLGVCRQHRQRQRRQRRNGAGERGRRQLSRLGRVQPTVADPRARIQLRRNRAHRSGLLRSPPAHGGGAARAAGYPVHRHAAGAWRGRWAAGPGGGSVWRHALRPVPVHRRRTLARGDRRRADGRHRCGAFVRTVGRRRARARRAADAQRLAAW